MIKERNFKKRKLPEKYIMKILYKCNNRKLEKEYLKRLEKN